MHRKYDRTHNVTGKLVEITYGRVGLSELFLTHAALMLSRGDVNPVRCYWQIDVNGVFTFSIPKENRYV